MTAGLTLAKAIYARLTGSITSGSTVPVYHRRAPPGAAYPYIILAGFNPTRWDTHSWDGREIPFTVHVYTRRQDEGQAETIADLINARLDRSQDALTLPGVTINYLTFEGATDVGSSDGSHNHLALEYRAWIQE